MSLLRRNTQCNNCGSNLASANAGEADTGILSVQALPDPSTHERHFEAQTSLARECQDKFAPQLATIQANTVNGSAQAAHPLKGNLQGMLPIMSDAALTFRLSHLSHGADAQASCAQMTVGDASKLLSNGNISIDAPRGGTFHLESSNNKTITGMRFTPAD